MPFNGSGTFSIVNTFIPNTTILSAAVNQNFTDIATGLSDCLTRDNQAGMTAIFRAVSGSVSAPGITFNSDTTAGLYLAGTGQIGWVAKSLGLAIDASVYCVSAATVQAGGSNYAVGDTITLTGGSYYTAAVLTVATLSGSAVATVTVTYPGFYVSKPSNPVSQGSTSGSGSSATFNLTWTTQYDRAIVVGESYDGTLAWPRLGASTFVTGLMAKANAYDFLRAIGNFSSGFAINTTTSPPTLTASLNPTLVPNYISGLTLSTAGGSGTMSIAAGVANDSTNATLMKLSSAISKTTSSWAVGTGNGGLDTGAIATNTWYHFYEIERVDTGVVDVIFSLSASSPTLPANYTLYRWIGPGLTNGSSQWVKFTQTGNQFIWDTPTTTTPTVGTSASSITLGQIPTGVVVEALLRVYTGAGGSNTVIFTSLQESDQSPAGNNGDLVQASAGAPTTVNIQRLTNTSAQIRARASNAGTGCSVTAYGFIIFPGTR